MCPLNTIGGPSRTALSQRRGARGGRLGTLAAGADLCPLSLARVPHRGNTVIRNAMERFGGPPRGADALMRYVERHFDRLHHKLDHMNRHAADQMFLLVSA